MPAATETFTGFTPDAIQFLADLAANNDRAWFQPRKGDYERTLEPGAFGLAHATAAELAGGDRRENAAIVSAVLSGENSPGRDIVVFNAAAALCSLLYSDRWDRFWESQAA